MDVDDLPHTASEVCVCGRTFCQPGALKKHLHSCSKSKKRLSLAIAKAKEFWSRKRRRVEDAGESESSTAEVRAEDGAQLQATGLSVIAVRLQRGLCLAMYGSDDSTLEQAKHDQVPVADSSAFAEVFFYSYLSRYRT
jgi:hypothetical protein